MAEDEALVSAIEASGLNFVGPCSRTVRQAGMKDEAKRTALAAGVSVTPGVDNLTVRTVLAKGSWPTWLPNMDWNCQRAIRKPSRGAIVAKLCSGR